MARNRTPPRPPLPRFAVAWFPAFRGIERIEANEFLFLVASRGAASIKGLHDRLYTRSLLPGSNSAPSSPT